jgi:endonuclease/exonuclease/phosphatase family metal-dependent hydrolase
VQVLNTHLGLIARERLAQAEALAGPAWLGHPDCRPPRLFCGDFNTWPRTRAFGRLQQHLKRARADHGPPWPRATFPARCPVLPIDHVFLSPDWVVRRVTVPRTRLTRIASDHLPVLVEAVLP